MKDPESGVVLSLPDSVVKEDGTILDQGVYNKIHDRAINEKKFKETYPKQGAGHARNLHLGTPPIRQFHSQEEVDANPPVPKWMVPNQYGDDSPSSTGHQILGYGEDVANLAELAYTPTAIENIGKGLAGKGLVEGAKFIGKNVAWPALAATGGEQAGEALDLDPEESQLLGAGAGLAAQSPKIMSFLRGLGGGFPTGFRKNFRASSVLGPAVGAITKGMGGSTGTAEVMGGLAAMAPEVPSAIRSGVTSSQGKDWMGPAFKSVGKDNIPGPVENGGQKSLPGYKITEAGPANLKQLPAPQKLLGPTSSIQQPPNDFFNRVNPNPTNSTFKDPIEDKVIEKPKESLKPKENSVLSTEDTNTPKIISKSEVEQFANDNGVSVEEAEKQFKDHTILDKSKMNRALHGLASTKGMTHEDLSDYASARFNVDSLSKLTDKQLHQIHQEISTHPDKELVKRTKSGGFAKTGKPATKDTLLEDLENSLKKK